MAISSKEKAEHPSHGMLGFFTNAVNILIVATTSLLEPEPVPVPEQPEPFQVPEPELRVLEPEQASSPPPSGRR
jgi:hypothetical protein